MIAKRFKFKDFKGVERSEEHMFNLSAAELAQLELKTQGTLTDKLKRLLDSPDIPSFMNTIEMLVEASYGVVSDDGRLFEKGEEIFKRFRYSPCYDQLMVELLSDDANAAKFLEGIMPEDLMKRLHEQQDKEKEAEKAVRKEMADGYSLIDKENDSE